MIARTWGGRVPTETADLFSRHLRETGVSDCRAAGCHSIELLRRDDGCGWSHFILVSRWETEEAMAAFAGPEKARAVLYPGDGAFGLVADDEVTLYRVLPLDPPPADRASSR